MEDRDLVNAAAKDLCRLIWMIVISFSFSIVSLVGVIIILIKLSE